MANFNSLPKAIRERIYELHLTQKNSISLKRYGDLTRVDRNCKNGRRMPALLQLSTRIEKEAAPFFYARNYFEFRALNDIIIFADLSWPRHRHLIRRLKVKWTHQARAASECFRSLASMRNLEELYIKVNERYMLSKLLESSNHKRQSLPQQNLLMLQHPGVAGLLKLRIPKVKFIKIGVRGKAKGGPIPGGALETIVAPKIMGKKSDKEKMSESEFPYFFSLSPELRNRTYDLLLQFDRPVTPTPNESASGSEIRGRLATNRPASVLSILAVNRQIHDEAVGIFYYHNAFVFNHMLHLHGFIQRLGSVRRSMITDITVHYEDFQRGEISLVDLTFDLLKSLTGLRKLEVIMSYQLFTRTIWRRYSESPKLLRTANPCLIPGMKILFTLRGLSSIRVRDTGLGYRYHSAKRQSNPTTFDTKKLRNAEKLTQVMEHFNAALQQAQTGKVNHALLEDKRWQMRDEFPELEDDEAVTTASGVGE
ncbi:hypothetical protein KC315_g1710 [Hortaea werneckii]|nr:hypothetical protein KC315_g1710 [Hortaea werneckii]